MPSLDQRTGTRSQGRRIAIVTSIAVASSSAGNDCGTNVRSDISGRIYIRHSPSGFSFQSRSKSRKLIIRSASLRYDGQSQFNRINA